MASSREFFLLTGLENQSIVGRILVANERGEATSLIGVTPKASCFMWKAANGGDLLRGTIAVREK